MSEPNTTEKLQDLYMTEVLIETNEGTFGAEEAMRKIGTGDPTFCTYRTYIRVGDGRQRTEGLDPAKAPGRARPLGWRQLRSLRSQLRALEAAMREELAAHGCRSACARRN